MQAVGSQSYIAFTEEAVYGQTPNAPAMRKLGPAIYGESLGATYDELLSNQISGKRARSAVRQGNQTVAGKTPIEATVANIGTLLKHTMGSSVTTGDGPYTHVLKRGALPVGLTLEKVFADIHKGFVFTGCKVNSLSLQIGSTGLVTGDLDFIGREAKPSNAPLGVPAEGEAHLPLAHHEATVTMDGDPLTVLALNMTVTNALSPTPVVGSRNIASLREGVGDVTGQITLMFEDMEHANATINETVHDLEVVFSNEQGSLGIRIPACRFMGDPVAKIASDQGVTLVLNIRGLYDSAAQSDVVITVISDEATI